MKVQLNRARSYVGLALALILCGGCVDEKIVGQSSELLLVDAPDSELAPGAQTTLAFQALDAEGRGTPDQALELMITDLARLRFRTEPAESRRIIMTTHDEVVGSAKLTGAVVVRFDVPADAPTGEVAVIGSLEGKKGLAAKTRWKAFTITSASEGGAGGIDSVSSLLENGSGGQVGNQ